MKVILLVFLISLTYAGTSLEQLTLGESCDKNPVFNILNFNVSPWPIVKTQQYTITVPGTFISKDYVKQMYVGTRRDSGFWHYTYQTVEQEYAKGANATFVISLQAPSDKGAYTDQVTFHRSDFSYCACWQYDYTIS